MRLDFNIAVYAALIAFAFCALLSPIFIPFLHKLKFGQTVRSDGPQTHLKKTGVPTMGGIVIIISILAASAIFSAGDTHWLIVVYMTVAFGLIGFCDDYIKVVKKRSMGLKASQKIVMQILATLVFLLILNLFQIDTSIYIPFTKGMFVDLGWLSPVFIMIAVLGTANGANFTDGLDGLASGVTILVALFFLFVAYASGSSLVPVIGAAAGALLGFLLFNAHPAKVFMGDTGSLALGGLVAGVAILLKMPLLILLVAFIYLAEVCSVILQVGYFKLTKGKRLFKMAPIHHHFEMMGWPETRVVAFFYIVTAVLCLFGFLAVNSLFK